MANTEGYKIVYLLVEKGNGNNRRTYWRNAGVAYPCRDGSFNLKLDIHPSLTFNIRDPKSNGENAETNESVIEEDIPAEEAVVEEVKKRSKKS